MMHPSKLTFQEIGRKNTSRKVERKEIERKSIRFEGVFSDVAKVTRSGEKTAKFNVSQI